MAHHSDSFMSRAAIAFGTRKVAAHPDCMHWGDRVTLVAIFLFYMNVPAIAVRFYGVAPGMAALLGVLFLVSPLYYLLVRRQGLIVDGVTCWGIAFLAIQCLSAVLSHDPERAMENVTTSLAEGLLLYVLLLNCVRSPAMLHRITWTLLLTGALLGALSLHQKKTHSFQNNYGGFAQVGIALPLDASPYNAPRSTERRASGPVGEVNRYGQIMLMLVPLGLSCFLQESSFALRLVALAATGLTVSGMMLSFSRGAAIGFVLLVILMVVLKYISLRQFALAALAAGLLVLMSDTYTERLLTLADLGRLEKAEPTDDDVDTSLQGRLTEVRAAFLMYAEHPLIGVGPGLYAPNYMEYAARVGGRIRQEEREPHSLYLGIAAELGTLGLAVFLAMVFTAVRGLLRARRLCWMRDPPLAHSATAFMLVLAAYLGTGLFLHFSYIRYFWMMLALGSAAARLGVAVASEWPRQTPEVVSQC